MSCGPRDMHALHALRALHALQEPCYAFAKGGKQSPQCSLPLVPAGLVSNEGLLLGTGNGR